MLPQLSGVTSDGAIQFAHVSDIRAQWPVILPGVLKIRDTNKEPWLPEDVYAALTTGRASLYVGYRDGVYTGFAVLEVLSFPFDANPAINIWLGYSAEKQSGMLGIEIAQRVAAAANVERIVFFTPQEGWPDKFRKVTTMYEV